MSGAATTLTDLFGALFPSDASGLIELRGRQGGVVARDFFRRGDLATIQNFIGMHTDKDLWFGVALRNSRISGRLENCGKLYALYGDIDFKDISEAEARRRLSSFPLPPSIIIQSGGGLHVYWLLREPLNLQDHEDCRRAESILRRLVPELGADSSSAELARILRVPGTLNHKYTPPRRVEIETFEPERQYNLCDLDDFLPEEPEPQTRNGRGFVVGERIREGERNTTIYRGARSMKAKEWTFDATLAAARAENQAKCGPALPDAEIEKIVAHAYEQADRGDFEQNGRNGASGGHSETAGNTLQPLPVLPCPDFLARTFPAADSIIAGGNLTRGGKLILAGQGGIGKSLIAITLGICLTARRTALNTFPVTALQRVGLFLCEDPAGVTQDRLRRQLAGMGLSEPPDGLFIFPRDERLIFGGRHGKPQEAIGRLIETVRRHALTVVIFDPLVSIHEADENSNMEMARWLFPLGEGLQREGCAIVLTHHTTWGQDGDTRSRGATAIQNWSDSLWLLRRIESGGREAVKLTVAKINFGPRWEPLILTLDPESLLYSAQGEQSALCPVSALLEYLRDEHGGEFRGKKDDLYSQVQAHFGAGRRTVREAFRAALSHQPPLLEDLGRGGGFKVIE